jgi:hypothetical protein
MRKAGAEALSMRHDHISGEGNEPEFPGENGFELTQNPPCANMKTGTRRG